MPYIALGALSFCFLFLFDLYTLRKNGILKRLYGLLGLFLLIFSAIMVTIVSPKIVFPLATRIAGGAVWFISVYLLIYSLFLELPFINTYGKKEHSCTLVDTGTYALCRHPGVLWFALVFCSFYFLTGAKLIIPAGIIWTTLDVVHVYLQEKLFFPKMFPNYIKYKSSTPMLIPTISSIKRCLSTI